MTQAAVVVLLSCALAAALAAEEHGPLSPLLQVIPNPNPNPNCCCRSSLTLTLTLTAVQIIVPDGAAAAENVTTLAAMARLVNVAMVSQPR